MNSAATEIRLVRFVSSSDASRVSSSGARAAAAPQVESVTIPAGRSYIASRGSALPGGALPGGARPGNTLPRVAASALDSIGAALAIEPVRVGRETRLVVFAGSEAGADGRDDASRSLAARVRVNGAPAPAVAILREGDELRVADASGAESVCLVALYHRPSIGPASAEEAGRTCPVCRTPIVLDKVRYACTCGALLHCESSAGEERSETDLAPADDRLECARVYSECPACYAPIVMAAGYARLPEPFEI